MEQKRITQEMITDFYNYLSLEEKSEATIEKYLRDVRTFLKFVKAEEITKKKVLEYKTQLLEKGYAVRSINSMLASLNSLFQFLEWTDCRVKNIRLQRQNYCAEEKELCRKEYLRLLDVAGKTSQLSLIMQTICATGIRVSELKYFTVESVKKGKIVVNCKSKTRVIMIPGKLKKILLVYAKKNRIQKDQIFLSKNGTPVSRCTIWAKMKKLSEESGVNPEKIFPHNLRKLFARIFYGMEKDIAKLADVLGHSSIETTRIYIMTSGVEHRQKIEQLDLVISDVKKVRSTEYQLC